MALCMSDLMLVAHQLLSLEEAERQALRWSEEKDIAQLHVRFRRMNQQMEQRRQDHNRKTEGAARTRVNTISRRIVALDGEEQKLRLAILKAEVLHLESVVRSCTKAVRGEVFHTAQDAQQRIKYFNKTLDVILKKESGGRRDLLGSERYEYLILRQRCDREISEAQRNAQLQQIRLAKQAQHDRERQRSTFAADESLSNSRSNRSTGLPQTNNNRGEENVVQRQHSKEPDAPIESETTVAKQEGETEEQAERKSPEQDAPAAESSNTGDAVALDAQADADEYADEFQEESPQKESSKHSRSTSRSSSSSSSGSGRVSPASPSRDAHTHSDHPPASENQAATSSLSNTQKVTVTAAKKAASAAEVDSAELYKHVQPVVVMKHPPAFFQRAFRELVAREEYKRLETQRQESVKIEQLRCHLQYLETHEAQRQQEIETARVGGSKESQERCLARALKRVCDDEVRQRGRLLAEEEAGWSWLIRKVNRTILHEREQQSVRLAKLASHTNRIARKLQRLEAEKQQLSTAVRESVQVLHSGAEADTGLAAIGESQPYPAIQGSPDGEESLGAQVCHRLLDIETKRRKYVEREAMLRRMVLQIYHRQKLKDFGFFDESKMREEQHKLAETLLEREAAEAVRLLAEMDERIAAAQLQSQQRLHVQRSREKLIRDEQHTRNDIAGEYVSTLESSERHWKALQRLSTASNNVAARESSERKVLEKEEARLRDGLVSHHVRFKPLPPKKPLDPLPAPPPKFEDAIKLYNEFYRKNGVETKGSNSISCNGKGGGTSSGSASGEKPPLLTSFFSTAGRKYLPPPKKHFPGADIATLSRTSLQLQDESRGTLSPASANSTIAAKQSPRAVMETTEVKRKPRPPPVEVMLSSATTLAITQRKKNIRAVAKLEPMKPPVLKPPLGGGAGVRRNSRPASSRASEGRNATPSQARVVEGEQQTSRQEEPKEEHHSVERGRSASTTSYESNMSGSHDGADNPAGAALTAEKSATPVVPVNELDEHKDTEKLLNNGGNQEDQSPAPSRSSRSSSAPSDRSGRSPSASSYEATPQRHDATTDDSSPQRPGSNGAADATELPPASATVEQEDEPSPVRSTHNQEEYGLDGFDEEDEEEASA